MSSPTSDQLRQVFRVARLQPRDSDSPEQRQFYDWIEQIYLDLGVGREVFARQLGVTPKMVSIWLDRRGHFPAGARLQALFRLWEANHG